MYKSCRELDEHRREFCKAKMDKILPARFGNFITLHAMLSASKISDTRQKKNSDKLRASLNKFPDFFRMGTFIDSHT